MSETKERVSNEQAKAFMECKNQTACGSCTNKSICCGSGMRTAVMVIAADLLDARRERDEAREMICEMRKAVKKSLDAIEYLDTDGFESHRAIINKALDRTKVYADERA